MKFVLGANYGSSKKGSKLPSSLLYLSVALAVQTLVFVPAHSAEIHQVRTGIHPDMTRIVIDLDGDIPFDVSKNDLSRSLIVKFPKVELRAPIRASFSSGLIQEYAFHGVDENLILRADTVSPFIIRRAFKLSPDSIGGHRVVIDLVPSAVDETKFAEVYKSIEARQPSSAAMQVDGTLPSQMESEPIEVAQGLSVLDWAKQEQERLQPKTSPPGNTEQQVPKPVFPAKEMEQIPSPQPAPEPRFNSRSDQSIIGDYSSVRAGPVYISASLGLSIQNDADIDGSALIGKATTESPGFSGTLAVGLNWGKNLRVEAEGSYSTSDADTLELTGTGNLSGLSLAETNIDGTVNATSLMINASYDFQKVGPLTPFLTGGLGGAKISYNDIKSGSVDVANDADYVFAYQLGGGMSHPIDERTSIDFSYKYFGTTDPELVDSVGDPYTVEFSDDKFIVGLRHNL